MNTTVIYGFMLTLALGLASAFTSGDVRTALMVAAGCSTVALVLTGGHRDDGEQRGAKGQRLVGHLVAGGWSRSCLASTE